MGTISQIPYWWNIIVWGLTIIWLTAMKIFEVNKLKEEMKEVKNHINCADKNLELYKSQIEDRLNKAEDWNREQLELQSKYNEMKYVTLVQFNESQKSVDKSIKAIDQRLERIEALLDKIWHNGKDK